MAKRKHTQHHLERLELDNFQCVVCHKSYGLHVHHITPVKSGGKDNIDNLATLCKKCHGGITTGSLDRALFVCLREAMREVQIARS